MLKDLRIRVLFGGVAHPNQANLVEADKMSDAIGLTQSFNVQPLHALNCACCPARTPAAFALNRLFLARARGEIAFFTSVRVVATMQGEAAVRACLETDLLTRARYRIAEAG